MKNKKIKLLNQTIRRQQSKITSLKSVIKILEEKHLLNEDQSSVLMGNFGKNKDLLCRLTSKNANEKLPRLYSAELRRFAISLHFFSPRAYNFIRNEFNSVLPHTRTLSKWYATVDAEPGICNESLNILKLKCQNTYKKIYCALIMDEVAIRKQLEFDGTRHHGYIDFGLGLNGDTVEMASECFVFLIVAINESWKLPVGYFLSNHLTSAQKVGLLGRCLDLLHATSITVVSLTFDGCPTNINMVKQLGCNLNVKSLESTFTLSNYQINILPDPAHMVKLVRNTFGEKQILIDGEGQIIDFNYIKQLLNLQDTENFHLTTKLKQDHVFYSRQKMKVKLATQLLSKSVADALHA